MRWILRIALLVAMVAALVVFPGCPGTDVLVVDTGEAVVVVQAQNSGSSRYEIISFSLTQVDLRPMDPVADAALGPSPIGLLASPLVVDNLASGKSATGVALNSGQYRVVRIVMQSFQLTDLNPPSSPATCIENFAQVPGTVFPVGIGVVSFPNLGDPVVTVTRSGGQITVMIDETEFVAAFEASFICRDLPGERCVFGSGQSFSAPCLAGFSAAPLQAATMDIFHIQ